MTTTTKKTPTTAQAPEDRPTLRDMYAIGAMIGAIVSRELKPLPVMKDDGAFDEFADECYGLADAMIARRNRP